MRDNELLIYGLLFLAIVGFNIFKQFLAARAQQQRREQQAAAAQGMPQPEDDPEPLALSESDWGRAPEPRTASDVPPPVPLEDRPVATRTPPSPAIQRTAQSVSRAQSYAEAPRASNASRLARRRRRHHLFQSRRAQREGIVMMTVLGPCRALQPYD